MRKMLILVSILYGFGNSIYPKVLGELLPAKVGHLNGAVIDPRTQSRTHTRKKPVSPFTSLIPDNQTQEKKC
jgi:hypothetical protein